MQTKKLLEKKRKNEKHNKSKFLGKLFNILNDKDYSNCIKWGDDGSSFIITNKFVFEKNVLSNFNHNNFSSFIRQLNNYNFHNVSLEKGEIKYQHDEFNKNKSLPEILLIQKKPKDLRNKRSSKKKEKKILNLMPKLPKEDKEKNKYFKEIIEKGELSNNLNEIILKHILDILEKNIDNQRIIKENFTTLISQNNKMIELLNNIQHNNDFFGNEINSPNYDENYNNVNFPYIVNHLNSSVNTKKNLKFSKNSRIGRNDEFN